MKTSFEATLAAAKTEGLHLSGLQIERDGVSMTFVYADRAQRSETLAEWITRFLRNEGLKAGGDRLKKTITEAEARLSQAPSEGRSE